MRKELLLVLIAVFIFAGNVFAGGVTDDNNGNLGDILVSTGENNGANSVGTWTDSSFLKGEQGEVGPQGPQGEQGPIGLTGAMGEQGIQGETGANGQDGHTPVKGEDYNDGKDGAKGDTGNQGERGETGRGLENRTELIGAVRIFDTRKWDGEIYAGRDFNNDVSIVGAKITYKFGKSWTEKELDKLNHRLDVLETANNSETYQEGTKVGIREKQ